MTTPIPDSHAKQLLEKPKNTSSEFWYGREGEYLDILIPEFALKSRNKWRRFTARSLATLQSRIGRMEQFHDHFADDFDSIQWARCHFDDRLTDATGGLIRLDYQVSLLKRQIRYLKGQIRMLNQNNGRPKRRPLNVRKK